LWWAGCPLLLTEKGQKQRRHAAFARAPKRFFRLPIAPYRMAISRLATHQRGRVAEGQVKPETAEG
jgi:hypothetical protein